MFDVGPELFGHAFVWVVLVGSDNFFNIFPVCVSGFGLNYFLRLL